MKLSSLFSVALVALVIPTLVIAQATRDFNWIPSGKIEMGNPEVEARFQYWADSPEMTSLSLPFAGGPKISYKGRTVSAEQFTVPVATFRGGPCPGALVIRKVWDTALPLTTFKVKVDNQELADWLIPNIGDARRWVQLFYVVPESVVAPKDDKGNPRPKWKVTVSLETETATPSYGYAFFITKDETVLGDRFSGGLSANLDKSLVPSPMLNDVSLLEATSGGSPVPYGGVYVGGIAYLGTGDYSKAIGFFEHLAPSANAEVARLARRMMRLVEYKRVAIGQPKVELSEECLRTHYLLGLYCSGNGFWE